MQVYHIQPAETLQAIEYLVRRKTISRSDVDKDQNCQSTPKRRQFQFYVTSFIAKIFLL